MRPRLTRYELSRLLGLRALQLAEGSQPHVHVHDEDLRQDFVYVAGLEIEGGHVDAMVQRAGGIRIHVSGMRVPPDLGILLDTRDGGSRCRRT